MVADVCGLFVVGGAGRQDGGLLGAGWSNDDRALDVVDGAVLNQFEAEGVDIEAIASS